MSDIIVAAGALPTMHVEDVARVQALEQEAAKLPQVEIETQHLLHAGMYARTVMIPAGVMITGALIKRATTLIVAGCTTVYVGGKTIDLNGYHVLPGGAGRKQVFLAHADTWLTMIFPTTATTVEDAEAEFTDETDKLISRRADGRNLTTVTGGASCLE